MKMKGRLPKPEDFEPDGMAERGLSSIREDFMHPDIWRRGYIPMPTDSDFPNINNFITSQFDYPGAQKVYMPSINPTSSALVVAFDTPPEENYYPYVTGLEGCTSVVIIGEKGCWLSHFWEAPWFLGAETNPQAFIDNVITPLENGAGTNMPSPFASGGQGTAIPELGDGATGFKPEILILSRAGTDGGFAYDAQVRTLTTHSMMWFVG